MNNEQKEMTRRKADRVIECRDDFERFLVEYGFNKNLVKAIVENEADQVPMPKGFNKLRLQESDIQGVGLFALVDANIGELLSPARITGKRTPAGRYTNHSPYPNARFSPLPNGDLDMIATCPIKAGEEVFVDYRQAGSVNGLRLPCNRQEMIATLRIRFANLKFPVMQDVELEQFMDYALDSVGYLPSVPDMISIIDANKYLQQGHTQ